MGVDDGVIALIENAFNTETARWLRSLPTYPCKMCGEETIFKGLCGPCDDFNYNSGEMEDEQDITDED